MLPLFYSLEDTLDLSSGRILSAQSVKKHGMGGAKYSPNQSILLTGNDWLAWPDS